MRIVFKNVVLAAGLLLLVGACQGVPADFKPDPALKTATPAKLQDYVQVTCIRSQRSKQSLNTTELSKACGCYARGAIRAMDKTDLDFLRNNGYFSDASRPKAQASFNACGLK